MYQMPKIGSLGGVLDAVGRAAVPAAPSPSRFAPPTPQFTLEVPSPEFAMPRTIDEAKVDHAAASGWQQRAPTFGRAIGIVGGVGLAVFALRALRSVFQDKGAPIPGSR